MKIYTAGQLQQLNKHHNIVKEMNDFTEIINDYRNSIKNSLKNEELDQVDEYIDKMLKDLKPVFTILENVKGNNLVLSELKKQLDTLMRENKWLEKP